MGGGLKKTSCVITIGGQNVSSAVLPRLISLSVTDKAGVSSDTVSIDIDDTDGVVLLPQEGVEITVDLGDDEGVYRVFEGTLDEVRSKGSRSGGMTISVSGKGFDTKGKAKEPKQKHWDDKSLKDVFGEAAEAAGLSVVVDSSLGEIKRPYWAQQTESFIHFGERIARENGATFKVVGKRAILAKRNGGSSAAGQALPAVSAVNGVNLLSWDIAPVLGRPRFRKVRTRHYNRKTATWQTEDVEVEDEDTEAEWIRRNSAGDADEAKAASNSTKDDIEREKGGGSISIDGTAMPQPEGTIVLSGSRPGIDGIYRIETVTQTFDRNSGWTTRLDVKQPQGDAGTDGRQPSSDAGSPATASTATTSTGRAAGPV